MSDIVIGMQVRHTQDAALIGSVLHTKDNEVLTVASVPFWFDGKPTVTLKDKKGKGRMTALEGLVAVNKNTEDTKSE